MKAIEWCLLMLIGLSGFSQQNPVDDLNQLLSGTCKAEIGKKKAFLAFNDGDKLIRTDEFILTDVDTARIEFSESESAVVLYCRTDYSGCFDRKIIKTKNHSRYSRMTIIVTNPQKGAQVRLLWKEILHRANE